MTYDISITDEELAKFEGVQVPVSIEVVSQNVVSQNVDSQTYQFIGYTDDGLVIFSV